MILCSRYDAYVGVPIDPKNSLGNLSRIKQLLILHARHGCGYWSFSSISILVINANITIKIAKHRIFIILV